MVREALTRHLEAHQVPFRMPQTFDSGETDVSERIDELAFKNFKIHGDDPPARG